MQKFRCRSICKSIDISVAQFVKEWMFHSICKSIGISVAQFVKEWMYHFIFNFESVDVLINVSLHMGKKLCFAIFVKVSTYRFSRYG